MLAFNMLAFNRNNWRPRLAAMVVALVAFGPSTPCAWASSETAAEGAPAESADVSQESAAGTRAIKLGEFNIRVFHSVSTRKDTVSFVVHATVKKDDYQTFERLYGHHKNKVRDQVVVATRLVPVEDYDDPELKKFRRRIMLRLRRSMPELPIEDLYLSDFSLSSESK
jgi:hypothetical protein